MKLFSYWGSPATYRVRFALAIKGLDAELTTLDPLEGDQIAQHYRPLNPEMAVSMPFDGDHSPLTQRWMRIP